MDKNLVNILISGHLETLDSLSDNQYFYKWKS